jgi:SAM-dependent methyltransferase
MGNRKIVLAYWLNEIGLRLIVISRRLLLRAFPQAVEPGTLERPDPLLELHREIDREIRRQKRSYPHYQYFDGYPYQQLRILSVFGERNTEDRFDAYGLAGLVGPDDTVLDVGCSCGFLAVYTAFRTGCRAWGVDVNEHMIAIGRRVADYLKVGGLVRLEALPFQEYAADRTFTVVFSCASHWTDDARHRPDFHAYLRRLHGLLAVGGRLIFESHTADVGNPEFHRKMEDQRGLFSWDGYRLLDNNTRELYVMTRLPAQGS